MIDSFWLIRFEKVLMRMWYDPKSFSIKKPTKFLIVCHGCPSHPYDRNPATNQRFLEEGYVLLYPDYVGTWGSDGQCTFENAVDTVLRSIDLLRKGSAQDIKSGNIVDWKVGEIILVGGSFGGSVVLVAGAKSEHVKKIIAVSPVTDWRTHNKLDFAEEDLETMWMIVEVMNKYWRVKKEDYAKLVSGELDLNPIDYVDVLKEKSTLLIHGLHDKDVHHKRSEDLHKELEGGSGKHELYLSKEEGHIVPRHLGQKGYYERVIKFLE